MGAQGSAERQCAQDEPFAGSTTRAPLLASQVGLVEDLRSGGVQHARAEGFSPDFQVCLPYRGLFVWHVGDDDVVGDANQVLYVSGGEGFRVSQPLSAAYAELIITPEPELLAELASASGRSLRFHPLFRQRSRRAEFGLQRLRACFLHESIHRNEIAREELMVALLRSSLDGDHHKRALARPTRRLIERTKEFLDANMSSPIRLADIAQAVGASPAYLTDVFRRTEGVPLHGYLTQLRLARALVELPHADDLTTLALALGFSSHSHFTSAFRRAFGRTPSQVRDTARGAPA